MSRDDEELDDDNEDPNDDGGEGDDGDDADGGAPPPAEPAARVAPAQKPRAPRGSRRSAGLGAAAPFESHLAFDLVGEVLERIEKFPGLGKPWDYNVQVLTMDGRDRHQGDRILGTFSIYRLQHTSKSPGELLQEVVTREYHFPRTEEPDTYDIRIVRAKTGKLFARAKLPLGSREEITAINRSQQEAASRQPPPPQGSWTGYGAPAPQYGAPPPYYPPQPPSPSADDYNDIRFVRAELQRTQGQLEEVIRAFREGRQPSGMGAAPAVAPAPAPARVESEDERIARIVAQSLRAAGIGVPAGVGAPAPAPAPAAPAASAGPPTMAEKLTASMSTGVEALVTGVVNKAFDYVGKTVDNAMKQAMNPQQPEEPTEPEDPPEPPEPPPDPMDKLPFELVPVKGLDGTPVKWPDGSPLMAGVDRETGDFSFKGSAIGNPFVGGQVLKVAQTLGEAAKNAASRVNFPDGSSVVGSTPRGARDAGMGSEPQRPQPQQAAPPPPPPPAPKPPPGPNGAAGGGGFPVL